MKKNWLVPVFAFLLVFSMAWPGYASTFQAATSSTQWSSVGPDFNQNTPQYLVTCQMTANSLLYVGTTTAGVWTFDGTTWTQLGGYYGLTGNAASVTSLAMDGNGNVYAGTCGTNGFNGDGVWEWDGESWSQLGGPDGLTGTDADIGCLCYADGTLYAGSNGGVSAASHTAGVFEWDGSSWTLVDPITGDNMYPVTSLAYSLGTLYCATDGLYVDAAMPNQRVGYDGLTWHLLNTGLGGSYYINCLIDADGTLYAGATSGLYQFGMGIVNGAAQYGWPDCSWTEVGNFGWINNLAYIDGTLYVLAAGAQTLDGTALGTGLESVGIDSLVSYDGDLYAGSTSAGGYGGLYVLNNGTWSPVYIGSTGTVAAVRSLASTGSTLNAGTNADGVWTMGSTSWTQAGSSGQFVNTTEVNSLTYVGSTLYAGTTDGVWTLNNATWTQVDSLGLTADVNSLADNGGTLYAGSNDGVWALNNGSWAQVDSSGLTGNAADVTSLTYTNNTLYAGTPDGVWVLNNGSWEQVDSAGLTGSAADVTGVVYANNILYAGTAADGVWALNNGSWAQVDSSGLTGNAADANSLNASSGTLYAGTNNGVWALNGGSWTQVGGSSGLTGVASYVSSLDVLNGTLYAGTEGGVWAYGGSISSITPITAIGATTGTAQVGSVLTAGALTPSGATATATYQWQESKTATGAYTTIPGATLSTYTPVAADAGDYIEVVATGNGSYSGSATSVAVGPAAGLAFKPLSGSTITTATPITIEPFPALTVNESVYYTTSGTTLTIGSESELNTYPTPLYLSVAGTVYAAVYDSVLGWGSPASATYTIGTTPSVQTATPTINPVYAGATSVSGTSADNASISLTVSGTVSGTVYTTTAGATGSWTVTPLPALAVGESISVTATAPGETLSAPATATVVAYPSGGGGGGGPPVYYTPAVQTEAATSVTGTSAVLNGDITSDNGYDVTAYGFLWGTSASSLTNTLAVGTNNESGAFTDTLSGLTDGTTYYFEAYATNSYGTADGTVLSVTAGVQTPTPAVQTEAATSVTDTSAVLNGDITSDNGYDVTAYGFLWGTSASSLTNTLAVGTNNQSGAFSDTLGNLTDGTTYYFEAYATNSQGTADGAVLSLTAGVQTPTTPTGTVFSDVPPSFWGYSIITSMSTQGIIAGYPDGTFKPNADITRAEFATMLAKALGLNITNTTTAFTDVAQGSWDYGPVNAAAAAGLVSGLGNNQFGPYTLITREQMAVMVAKAMGAKAPVVNGTELNAFNDGSQVSSWAVTGMDEAVKAGIVIGMSADHLAPQAHATRAQAAAMIYQLLNFLGK
jgi:hypothetical protein